MENSLRTIDYTIIGQLLNDSSNYHPDIHKIIFYQTEKKLIGFQILDTNEVAEIITNVQTKFLPKPLTSYSLDERHCNRVCVIDEKFAKLLYHRISPIIKDLQLCEPNVEPIRINECFRISEYKSPSIGFSPHYDNQYNESDTIKSIFSIVIYLNDTFEGGETLFYEPKDKLKLHGGMTIKEEIEINGILGYKLTKVRPIPGYGILFDHSFLHASDQITRGTKYIIRTDLVFENKSQIKPTRTSLDQLKYYASLNFFRDAQFLELQGDINQASEMYQRATSQKIHRIPSNDLWFFIIQYLNFNEMDKLANACKSLRFVIRSKRSTYWKSLCETDQKIDGPWIPRVLAKKGCLTKFRFMDKQFFHDNFDQCLRVIAMYCIYLFTNKLMRQGSGTYCGKYDHLTGQIHRCDLTNLLTCAFYEKPIFGEFFNFYKHNPMSHQNFDKSKINIDQRFIEQRHPYNMYPDDCIDYNLLEMEYHDEYTDSLKENQHIIQIQQIKKETTYRQSVECIHSDCPSYDTDCSKRSTISTNCLMFDFSKQKIKIKPCTETKCKVCSTSSYQGKGYVVDICELQIPDHMHAACRHYYRKIPDTSTYKYQYDDTKYIDKIHIVVSDSKKAKIETYYEGYY